MYVSVEEMEEVFRTWDSDYREKPEEFQNVVEHLLRSTPEEYGANATVCFKAYLEKIRKGNR